MHIHTREHVHICVDRTDMIVGGRVSMYVCHMFPGSWDSKKRNDRSGKNSGESQRDTLRNETLNQRFSTFLTAATILSISE